MKEGEEKNKGGRRGSGKKMRREEKKEVGEGWVLEK